MKSLKWLAHLCVGNAAVLHGNIYIGPLAVDARDERRDIIIVQCVRVGLGLGPRPLESNWMTYLYWRR